MKNNIKNLKRFNLAGYSLLAGAFLLIKEDSTAQISFTDLVPDVLLDAELNDKQFYKLDFDGDGIEDLHIVNEGWLNSEYYAYSAYILGRGKAGDRIAAGPTYFYEAANALPYGQWIEKGEVLFMRFAAAGKRDVCLGADYGWGGPSGFLFDDGAHGYVGVSLTLGDGLPHYGWIEITTGNDGDFVKIHGYAYEQKPKVGINAGATGELRPAMEHTKDAEEVQVYPTLSGDGMITMEFTTELNAEMPLQLVNEVGITVYRKMIVLSPGVNHHQLDIGLFPNGNYFLRLNSKEAATTRRIVLQQ